MRWERQKTCFGALALAAAAAAGCGGDGDRDVTALTADVVDLEAPEGTIVSVSPVGTALVRGEDELCALTLEGESGPCFDVVTSIAEDVAWSDDGTRAAIGAIEFVRTMQDSDVTVIDLEAGDVTTIADDGTDDADQGDVDMLPAWDGDELMFLRMTRPGADAELSLVRVEDVPSGEVALVSDSTGLGLLDLASVTVAAADGEYFVLIRSERSGAASTRLIAIDDSGRVDERVIVRSPQPTLVGGGGRLVVTEWDVARFEAGPVTVVGPEADIARSDFEAVGAAPSPDGSLIAALSWSDGEPGAVTIWEPSTGHTVEVVDEPLGRWLVWLDDDRLVQWDTDEWQLITLHDG